MAAKKSPIDLACTQFQDKNFENAAVLFEKIIGEEDQLPSVAAVARKYLRICKQQIALAKEAQPKDSLAYVSFLMNSGDFEKAREILANVNTSLGTKEFLLAEMAIEEDKESQAVNHLKKAIEDNKDFRGYALNSIVLAPHVNKEAFGFLQSKTNE